MTARPLRAPRAAPRLRVLPGRRTGSRPLVAPWVAFAVVVVVAMLGMVVARTSLDKDAFVLSDLQQKIATQTDQNEELRVQIAELENPARIEPLARELGLVYPEHQQHLMVPGVVVKNQTDDPRWAEIDRLAAGATP